MCQFNKIDNLIIGKADTFVLINKSRNICEINNELFNNKQKPEFDRILNLLILEFAEEEILLEKYCENQHSVQKSSSDNKSSLKDILHDDSSQNTITLDILDNNLLEIIMSEDNSLQVLFTLFIFILNHEGLSAEILLKHFSVDKIVGLVIFILYKNKFIKSAIFETFNKILLKMNRTKNYQIYKILEFFQLLEKNNLDVKNYQKKDFKNEKIYLKNKNDSESDKNDLEIENHEENEFYEYYVNIIITGLMICEPNVSFLIIKKMAQLDKKLILWNLKYFSNTFSIQKTDVQVNIILFLEFIDEFEVIYKEYLFKILEKTAVSHNSLAINQFYLLFNNKKVTEFIHINIKKILPKVFENLYRNSKRSWSVKERIEYSRILDFFVALDPETFRKSLIKYNTKKQLNNINK